MNPKLQFIFSRRSVRRYQEKDIPEELFDDLLRAAMAAPSAVKKDPWHFIVIRKPETLNKVADQLPNGQMLRRAPGALIVCGDIDRAHDRQESYLLQDCSAAIENTLLAANALGLGACWLGIHPRRERMAGIRALFDLPDHIIPVSGIALGWPAERPEPRTRFNAERVHREAW